MHTCIYRLGSMHSISSSHYIFGTSTCATILADLGMESGYGPAMDKKECSTIGQWLMPSAGFMLGQLSNHPNSSILGLSDKH